LLNVKNVKINGIGNVQSYFSVTFE